MATSTLVWLAAGAAGSIALGIFPVWSVSSISKSSGKQSGKDAAVEVESVDESARTATVVFRRRRISPIGAEKRLGGIEVELSEPGVESARATTFESMSLQATKDSTKSAWDAFAQSTLSLPRFAIANRGP